MIQLDCGLSALISVFFEPSRSEGRRNQLRLYQSLHLSWGLLVPLAVALFFWGHAVVAQVQPELAGKTEIQRENFVPLSSTDLTRISYFEQWAGSFYKSAKLDREDLRSENPTRRPIARFTVTSEGKVASVVMLRSCGSLLYDELLQLLIRDTSVMPRPPLLLVEAPPHLAEITAEFEWRKLKEEVLVRVLPSEPNLGEFRRQLGVEVGNAIKEAAVDQIRGVTAELYLQVSDGRITDWRLLESTGSDAVDAVVAQAMRSIALRVQAPLRPPVFRVPLRLAIPIE